MKNYYTATEVGRLLKCSYANVLILVRKGVLPNRRFGGTLWFTPEDVEAAKNRPRAGKSERIEATTEELDLMNAYQAGEGLTEIANRTGKTISAVNYHIRAAARLTGAVLRKGANNLIVPDAEDLLRAYNEGKGARELAAKRGCSHQRISQIVHAASERLGVPLRNRIRGVNKRLVIPPDLIEKYRAWEITSGDIAHQLGCCRLTVYKMFSRQGVRRDPARKPPTKSERMYAAFKAGATMKEVAEQFKATETYVGVSITRERKRNLEPYYRYPESRRSPGRRKPA